MFAGEVYLQGSKD